MTRHQAIPTIVAVIRDDAVTALVLSGKLAQHQQPCHAMPMHSASGGAVGVCRAKLA